MRRLLALILAIVMTFSISVVAVAAEIEGVEVDEELSVHAYDEEEYFRFKNSVGRMNSAGEFEFYCNSYMYSDNFVADSDQITIEAWAKIYNRNTGKTSTSSTREFTITVHKVGGSDLEPVLTAKLNGKTGSVTVDVEKDEEYYLIIRSSSTLDAILYMDGEGSVSPIT